MGNIVGETAHTSHVSPHAPLASTAAAPRAESSANRGCELGCRLSDHVMVPAAAVWEWCVARQWRLSGTVHVAAPPLPPPLPPPPPPPTGAVRLDGGTAMQKLRIVTITFGTARQKLVLE